MIVKNLLSSLKYMVLLLLVCAVIVPLLYVAAKSFTPADQLGRTLFLPETYTLRNYDVVLFHSPFLRYLLNTVFLAVTITFGSLFIDSMAAYGLARIKFPGRNLIFLSMVAMLIVPLEVLILPRYMLMNAFGWVDDYKALIIPSLSWAFNIFFLRQFFIGLPKELEESASIDGCGRFRVYYRIILPLVKAPLLTIGLLTFFTVWDDFLWPLTVINTPAKYVLQVAVSTLDTEYSTDVGAKFSNAVLSSMPVVILFLFVQRHYISGITAGAVKE